jgi:uncharacterized protein YdaU (DUF1376 family)
MSGNNLFMPVWIDAYHADTQHLSTVQHGAYLLILMSMWRNGGKLPNDERRLAIIAKMTLDKWRRYGRGIMDLLVVEDGMVTQKRLLQELEKSRSKIEKKRAAGKAGGTAKSLKTKGSKVADSVAEEVADEQQEGKQTAALYSLLSTTPKKPSVSVGEEASADEPLPWEVDPVKPDADPEPAPRPAPKTYAFEEGIVRLTEADFEKWRARYPNINLESRLASMVEWAEVLQKEGKNWFRVFPARLAKLEEEARTKKEEVRLAAEAKAKQGAKYSPGQMWI